MPLRQHQKQLNHSPRSALIALISAAGLSPAFHSSLAVLLPLAIAGRQPDPPDCCFIIPVSLPACLSAGQPGLSLPAPGIFRRIADSACHAISVISV
jgi:hypothetical protein